jgi:hypothetical protein
MTDMLAKALRVAVSQTERNPTDAQKESGNYRKGKLSWNGLQIAIENPKGGTRSGVDKGGKRWEVRLPAAYGYFLGTEGKDGDHVDTYVGSDHGSQKVFVIDQVDAGSGRFDEHKVMLAYGSKAAALADYEKAFSDGKAKDRIGAVTTMAVDDFKTWLRNGNTKKPLGDIRKGYATGGVVDMPSKMRSPADRALSGYADGGAPDWRSDMDVAGPGYDPRRGEVRGEKKPDILREVRPAAERALDAVLDYGSVPARTAVGMAMEPMTAIGEAYDDPSLENVTNAGVKSALALGPFAPLKAGKAFLGTAGLGFGAAGARDAGLIPEAQADDDGLSSQLRSRLQALQKKKSLSRAEREEQNKLLDMQAAYADRQAKMKFEAQARRDAALVDAETAKRSSAQEEFDRSVGTAERARDAELSRDRRFSDTNVGKMWDKAGGWGPAAVGAALGGASRIATGGGSLMKDYGLPMILGGVGGAASNNVPLAYNAFGTEPDNPKRQAYEAYARELPPSHPRKGEWQEYARGLEKENPIREAAAKELYDPGKAAERMLFGAIEGIGGGALAADVVRWPGRVVEGVAAIPGRARAAASRSNANADLIGRDASSARSLRDRTAEDVQILDAAGDEAQRRISAPGAASGLSEPAAPPRRSPASEVVPSPSDSPLAPTSKRSAPKVKKQDAVDPKALKAEISAALSRAPSDEAKSVWGLAPKGIDEALDNPEVIMLTKDKLGRKQFRTTEGRYRGGPVTGKPPSMLNRALDVARKFANGGVVTGAVVGETGGREDAKPVDVAAGSYVIPADCVSAAGQGNTLSGMEYLKEVFGEPTTRAAGGAVGILISDGEYVLTPEQVEKIGGGDMKKGHQILDQLVRKLRAQHIDTLKSLPGPAKG